MGRVKCEITTAEYFNGAKSDGFTVEVKSKDGKVYQKRASFMNIPFLPNLPPGLTYDKSVIEANKYEKAVLVTIYVNYGDVITATRGSGGVYLKDENSTESGRYHSLSVVPNPTDKSKKKAVTVTKETVENQPIKLPAPDPKAQKKSRPSTSVWDA